MNPEIVNAIVFEDRVEITYRLKSHAVLCSYPPQPAPDAVWKDVYIVKDGKLVFDKKVNGVHAPARTTPERSDFPPA